MSDKVYVEDFNDGPGGWEEWPNPLVVKDSYAMTRSPWWVDFNHASPGGGYLHLLYFLCKKLISKIRSGNKMENSKICFTVAS